MNRSQGLDSRSDFSGVGSFLIVFASCGTAVLFFCGGDAHLSGGIGTGAMQDTSGFRPSRFCSC